MRAFHHPRPKPAGWQDYASYHREGVIRDRMYAALTVRYPGLTHEEVVFVVHTVHPSTNNVNRDGRDRDAEMRYPKSIRRLLCGAARRGFLRGPNNTAVLAPWLREEAEVLQARLAIEYEGQERP